MPAVGIQEGSTGMLVVESVVPGGPADGVLEPGDVLVGIYFSGPRGGVPGGSCWMQAYMPANTHICGE